jgi:hypothetical protein
MQHLNNGFSKFKVDDLTHVKMLIIQENVKKLTKPFKYNCKTLRCMHVFQYILIIATCNL